VDAVRFCHAAQVFATYYAWPTEFGDWYCKLEGGLDGAPLHNGPAIAMAIHESSDYSTRVSNICFPAYVEDLREVLMLFLQPVPQAKASPDNQVMAVDYLGPAEDAVKVLRLVQTCIWCAKSVSQILHMGLSMFCSEIAHGGQVLLSESAWSAVQDQLPGQPQVVSLGTHWVDEPCFPRVVMLMEVMPSGRASTTSHICKAPHPLKPTVLTKIYV
jgi:hypothetical protein